VPFRPGREKLSERLWCDLAARWGVDHQLIQRVQEAAVQFAAETGRDVWIISGHRTRGEQLQLQREGRPTAPDQLSTHRACPSQGIDISLGPLPVRAMKWTWGRIAILHGLRWGGGSRLDENGLPTDWQHVDMGPRQ